MTKWRLHYHLIWSTHERLAALDSEREQIFMGVCFHKAEELGLKIHAVGVVSDHVHLIVSIPPNRSVSECVRQLKGASSYAINQMTSGDGQFKWQNGFAGFTVDDRSLESSISYVLKQKEHHRDRTFQQDFEQL